MTHFHSRKRYLHLAIGIVKRNDIRLVPRTSLHGMMDDPPPSYSEEVSERISFLINLMYSEVILTHISGPAPMLLSDLWEQFEHELPIVYPVLFKRCPFTMRLGSLLLAIHAADLLGSYKHEIIPLTSWFYSCDKYLSSATSHVTNTLFRLNLYKNTNELDNCVFLLHGSYNIFLTLVEIDRILERHPLSLQCLMKCKDALKASGRLIHDISSEDLEYLHQVNEGCLGRTFSVFAEKCPVTGSPLFPMHSDGPAPGILASSSIFLLDNHKDKLASIRLDYDALPVCERLETIHLS